MTTKLVLFLALTMATPLQAGQSLVLGRAPQQAATVTAANWTPLVQALSAATGVEVVLRVYEEREAFEADLKAGGMDLYFGNPGYAVVGHLRHGYLPVVRSGQGRLEAIVVTRKGGGIDRLGQLRGQTIAFPSQTAFAASLYLRAQLKVAEALDFTPHYLDTHDNAYRAVLIGEFPAAGGVRRTLEREPPELQAQLQVVYQTPGMSPHPLMAHPRVAASTRLAIQSAVLALNNSDDGRALLKATSLQAPVASDYRRDYQGIEAVATEMYDYLLHD